MNLTVGKLKNIIKNNNGNIREVINLLNISKKQGEEQDIIEILEEVGIDARICDVCNKIMIEGYCIEDGDEYACQDTCLHQLMTPEYFEELYADGEGSTYYTNWCELDENGQVIGGLKYAI